MSLRKKAQSLKHSFRDGYMKSVEEHPRLEKMLPFISKLFLAGLVFRGIIYLNPDSYILQRYLAAGITEIMNLFGFNYRLQGITIIAENSNYLINQDCLGWKSVSAFTALIYASSSIFRKHLKTVLIGSIALILANIVRIISTIWLTELGIVSFDIIHTFLWRWGMTLIVLLIWYLWLKHRNLAEI